MKKLSLKRTLYIISTVIVLLLLIVASSIYSDKPVRYHFYDADKQTWNEIRIEFPNPKLGPMAIMVITSEDPIYSLEENSKREFIEYLNNNLEVTQISGTETTTSFPQPLDQYGDSFLTIPPDRKHDEQTSVIIRMKEDLPVQYEALGNIYLDEFPK